MLVIRKRTCSESYIGGSTRSYLRHAYPVTPLTWQTKITGLPSSVAAAPAEGSSRAPNSPFASLLLQANTTNEPELNTHPTTPIPSPPNPPGRDYAPPTLSTDPQTHPPPNTSFSSTFPAVAVVQVPLLPPIRKKCRLPFRKSPYPLSLLLVHPWFYPRFRFSSRVLLATLTAAPRSLLDALLYPLHQSKTAESLY